MNSHGLAHARRMMKENYTKITSKDSFECDGCHKLVYANYVIPFKKVKGSLCENCTIVTEYELWEKDKNLI